MQFRSVTAVPVCLVYSVEPQGSTESFQGGAEIGMIWEDDHICWTWKTWVGSGCGLFQGIIPAFTWKDLETTKALIIVGVLTKI